MKKYIVFMIVLGLFTFGLSAPKVQAVTLEDLQKQIQILSEQVDALKSQLKGEVLSSVTNKNVLADDYIAQKLFSNKDLKRGDTGIYVKLLQGTIAEKYLPQRVDGIFGLKTTNAVLALQKDNNLPATGIVDLATKKVLLNLNTATPYEKYAIEEINKYIQDNKIKESMLGKDFSVTRQSTNGELRPSSKITVSTEDFISTLDKVIPPSPQNSWLCPRCCDVILFQSIDPETGLTIDIVAHYSFWGGWKKVDWRFAY